jgi:hypothetical protein
VTHSCQVAASSASLIAGFVIRRTGRYKTLTILSCFSALVGCLLLATFKEGSTPTWIYWMAIVPAARVSSLAPTRGSQS